jgi:hypothetical protein
LNESGTDVLNGEPDAHITGNELRAIVTADESWSTTLPDHLVQDVFHVLGRERLCHSQGQGLPGELIGEAQDLQRLSSQGLIEDKVVCPDVIGELGLHRDRRSGADFPAGLRFDSQGFLTPDSPDLLPVEMVAVLDEQGVNEPVTPPWMQEGQVTKTLSKFAVLATFRLVVPGRFGEAHQEASPFGLDACRDEFPHHGTFLSGRHRFF